MIYGSSRGDVNRVSKVISKTHASFWTNQVSVQILPFSSASSLLHPLLFVVVDSSWTFAQFWLFAAVTLDLVLWNSSKSALDMLINSLTHGNEVTSILFLTWCFLRFYLQLVYKVLRLYAGIHAEEQFLFAYFT